MIAVSFVTVFQLDVYIELQLGTIINRIFVEESIVLFPLKIYLNTYFAMAINVFLLINQHDRSGQAKNLNGMKDFKSTTPPREQHEPSCKIGYNPVYASSQFGKKIV